MEKIGEKNFQPITEKKHPVKPGFTFTFTAEALQSFDDAQKEISEYKIIHGGRELSSLEVNFEIDEHLKIRNITAHRNPSVIQAHDQEPQQ